MKPYCFVVALLWHNFHQTFAAVSTISVETNDSNGTTSTTTVQNDNFFLPYGASFDFRLTACDYCVHEISFDMPFCSSGQSNLIRKVCLISNGFLQFSSTSSDSCQSTSTGVGYIHFLHGNIDTSSGGNIYYRQSSTEMASLDRVATDVAKRIGYKPTLQRMFVATFENVPPDTDDMSKPTCRPSQSGCSQNTAQVIIAVDDSQNAFGVFYYRKIEWTNRLSQLQFFEGQDSTTSTCTETVPISFFDLPLQTNIGEAGKYVLLLTPLSRNISTLPNDWMTTSTLTTPVPVGVVGSPDLAQDFKCVVYPIESGFEVDLAFLQNTFSMTYEVTFCPEAIEIADCCVALVATQAKVRTLRANFSNGVNDCDLIEDASYIATVTRRFDRQTRRCTETTIQMRAKGLPSDSTVVTTAAIRPENHATEVTPKINNYNGSDAFNNAVLQAQLSVEKASHVSPTSNPIFWLDITVVGLLAIVCIVAAIWFIRHHAQTKQNKSFRFSSVFNRAWYFRQQVSPVASDDIVRIFSDDPNDENGYS